MGVAANNLQPGRRRVKSAPSPLAGNPAKDIDDVEKVEAVFKDGIGLSRTYDPAKLKRSAAGLIGLTKGTDRRSEARKRLATFS